MAVGRGSLQRAAKTETKMNEDAKVVEKKEVKKTTTKKDTTKKDTVKKETTKRAIIENKEVSKLTTSDTKYQVGEKLPTYLL